MYLPEHFSEHQKEVLHTLIMENPFGTLNRPWFPRHSPSSENSVSHTLLATAA
ncbi:FMN-binding negative transcriptional regulator [Pseudomonas sp. UBA4617]|uniref:FMN-binding negative transcriptional regulator n=1 Tax=Pseudomonas sp. UBA4617 TaxID=1947318 RepID=UPI0039C94762